jgi:iron-sulfur cluster insertion protein
MSTIEKEPATAKTTAPAVAPVTIDQSALDRIEQVRKKEGLGADVKLRIAIVGGGCSGFKYAMGLTDELFGDDKIFGDAVVIDEASLDILAGSKISYQDNLTGAQFVIDNPNVSSGCGCGNSFAVKGDEEDEE